MESLAQLKQNIAVFDKSGLEPDQVRLIEQHRPLLAERTLDPSRWSK
jgi:hypothetical protein